MRLIAAIILTLALSPAGVRAGTTPVPTEAPAGNYHLDPEQITIMAGVDRLGLSTVWLVFTRANAALRFDPADPEGMDLAVKIDPASVRAIAGSATDPPLPVSGASFLDAARYPEITFQSDSIRLVAPDRAAVSGDLTLHGVRRRITLSVTFNGGRPAHPDDPGGARVGFSARGTIFRSDFGMTTSLPASGMPGIGDEVAIRIEAEFINPGASGPQLGP